MASTAPTSLPALFRSSKSAVPMAGRPRRVGVFAVEGSVDASRQRRERKPGVDTRIHWDNPDDGWIGGNSTSSFGSAFGVGKAEDFGEENLSDLIKSVTGTYYEFLGISAQADMEEIKVAYRRLSKEYHPDTTLLPLKAASDKFVRLREAYDVLSEEKCRQFYDRDLAEQMANREAKRMRLRLEDPYEQDVRNWESVPDMVDRLGGKNMELSDQTLTALTFDIVAIIVTICCITYALFFKEAS